MGDDDVCKYDADDTTRTTLRVCIYSLSGLRSIGSMTSVDGCVFELLTLSAVVLREHRTAKHH
jgi:hypothetical protein